MKNVDADRLFSTDPNHLAWRAVLCRRLAWRALLVEQTLITPFSNGRELTLQFCAKGIHLLHLTCIHPVLLLLHPLLAPTFRRSIRGSLLLGSLSLQKVEQKVVDTGCVPWKTVEKRSPHFASKSNFHEKPLTAEIDNERNPVRHEHVEQSCEILTSTNFSTDSGRILNPLFVKIRELRGLRIKR